MFFPATEKKAVHSTFVVQNLAPSQSAFDSALWNLAPTYLRQPKFGSEGAFGTPIFGSEVPSAPQIWLWEAFGTPKFGSEIFFKILTLGQNGPWPLSLAPLFIINIKGINPYFNKKNQNNLKKVFFCKISAILPRFWANCVLPHMTLPKITGIKKSIFSSNLLDPHLV